MGKAFSKNAKIAGASITFLLFLLFGGLLATCQIDQPKKEIHSVAATIFPVYDLARAIAGDRVDVQLIIEPGVSEHSFEATPSLARRLAGTDAIVFIGAGLDDWVKDVAPNTAQLVDLSTAISLLEVKKNDTEFPTSKDPHYWLSPQNAIVLAGEIRDQLIVLQANDQAAFEQNYQTLVADLRRLDSEARTSLAVLPSRNIATFHEAWSYFARDFNLNIVATFEPFPGQAPSPQDVAFYEQAITTYGLKTIYSEPQLANDALKQVSKDLNVQLAVLDPIGGVPGRDSYRKLIEYNVATIRNALLQNN